MLEEAVEEIGDGLPVFGPEGLGLDSVDALQLVVGLEKGFGLKISDAAAAKETLQDVNHMAAAIEAFRAEQAG
ncbi:MAG: phosphopantetheine-binding protein [Verrucomicrobiota bacterium]